MHTAPFAGVTEIGIFGGQITVEGICRGCSVENNGGEGGRWSYRGSITVQTIHGAVHELDLLDVVSIKDVSERRIKDYEEAGLIRIVDLPDDE